MNGDYLTYYTLTFVLYAFIGYLCEVAYCSIGQRHLVNRGFLYGPWLPIYGFGGLVVDIFITPLKNYPIVVFILGVLLTSIIEYIGSFLLEKIFSIKLWDYKRYKFNINGRVCLLNSTLFGVMSLFLVYLVQPYIDSFISLIPFIIQENVADALRVLFAIDLSFSIVRMSGFKKALKEVRDKAKDIEEKAKAYAQSGRKEFSEEYRVHMSNELNELRLKVRTKYSSLISSFPGATSRIEEVKEQLGNIQAWAKERYEANREYKERLREDKKAYKEKVREINRKKGKND